MPAGRKDGKDGSHDKVQPRRNESQAKTDANLQDLKEEIKVSKEKMTKEMKVLREEIKA
jgi:hypothetical protein